MTRLTLVSLAALALLTSACFGGDDDEEPTPTSTAIATIAPIPTGTSAVATSTTAAIPTRTASAMATATVTATSSASPGREYTGLPAVDAIIAAVLSGDVDRVTPFVQLRQVACGPQAGIGSPPPCPAGQPAGTPVPVFPVATCEGEWRPESAVRPSVQPLMSAPELYAVYGMPSRFQALMPDGQYVAVFSRTAPGQGRVGAGVVIAGARIVGLWYGCDATADQLVPAGTSTILAPPR